MEDVVTGIDGLLKYVSENGETDATMLASNLKVSENTIQEWSLVLERAKLVRIAYKMGRMYVGPATVSVSIDNQDAKKGGNVVRYEKMTPAEMENLAGVKSSIMKDQLAVQEKEVDNIAPKIKELREYIQEVQKGFKDRSAELNKYLAELNALKDESAKSFSGVSSYKQQVDKLMEELSKSSGMADGGKSAVGDIDDVSGNVEAIIADMRAKGAALRGSSENVLSEFDAKASEQRKQLVQFSSSARQEAKKIDELVSIAENMLAEYRKRVNSYKHEFDSLLAKSSRERAVFLDKTAKAKKSVDRAYDLAGKKAGELDALIAREQGGLARLTELDRGIKDLKQSIEGMSAERDAIKKEIGELNDSLDGISKGRGGNIMQERKDVSEAEEKVKKVGARIKGLGSGSRSVGKKIDGITKKR